MYRKVLFVSVASGALMAASIPSAYAQLQTISGEINPFAAEINPFSGPSTISGEINPFSSEINPFRGDINPFYGEVSPFWGEISPFWGEINPFTGDISPFWGDINPFTTTGVAVGSYWQSAGTDWAALNTSWGSLDGLGYTASTAAGYIGIQTDFVSFLNTTRTTWESAVTAQTGQSFDAAFADPLFAKYGLNPNDASSFANMDAVSRSQFFLDWYDGLMAYSGADIVDHWMATVKWNPAITQDQGEGHDAIVGLLDMRIAATDDNIEYLTNVGGYDSSTHSHGAAVASLIGGRHDGSGVMGIAPRANVLAYSPFTSSGTASIEDVEAGILTLTQSGANVINMSLGYPNMAFHQDMANALSRNALQPYQSNTVYVIASGNNGIVQTQNVEWGTSPIANMIIVGSVDPSKNISFFANQVGNACLTVKGICHDNNLLMNHYLVAPGELILASDNAGGTQRVSGTSFAAPLVTGAVSLIHDRWPWLQNYAKETVDIIFETAEDLGAPGVDPVYGHGLLDVEAATSPISFDNLQFYTSTNGGADGYTGVSAAQLKTILVDQGQLNLWDAQGASLIAYENIGATYRDFTVSLSSLLGQTSVEATTGERFQRHVNKRLFDWANAATNSLQSQEVSFASAGDWGLSVAATPVSQFAPSSQQNKPFSTSVRFTSRTGKTEVQFGEGMGATMLTSDGRLRRRDVDPADSGQNPFLGLASGGAFASVTRQLAPGMDVSFGFTNRRDDNSYVDGTSGESLAITTSIDDYSATALTMNIGYRATQRLRMTAAYTDLREENGALGARMGSLLAFGDGAHSRAMTIGAQYDVTSKFALTASATSGRTETGRAGTSMLQISDEGLSTTAFEIGALARDIVKKGDDVRLSLSQPLYTETGSITYTTTGVVDRATGELGVVSQDWALGGGQRRLIADIEYALPIGDGNRELRLFGRLDMNNVDATGEYDAVAAGATYTGKF